MTDASKAFAVLSVRLRDQSSSVTELSRLLGLPTSQEWSASDLLRRGPNFLPRERGENYWSSDAVLEDRGFESAISRIVETLNRHQERMAAFTAGGGKLEVYLQLNGEVNAGDSLPANLLRLLGELGAELQIEVFPHFTR